jgi:cytochrome c peroxidase
VAPVLEPVRESYRTGKSIQWTRVHDLPQFVYFDHSIHIHKGIGCSSCHGRVDRMPLTWQAQPLTMAWCLDCHRNPEMHVRPRERVFDMDYTPPPNQAELGQRLITEYHIHRLTSCSTCHR